MIGAVCLYPQEAIERVRADGHQSFPGSYGENLTLLGIDWARLRAGDLLAIGDEDDGPLLELTKYATPCQTQAHWFTRGADRPDQPRGPPRGRALVRAGPPRGGRGAGDAGPGAAGP